MKKLIVLLAGVLLLAACGSRRTMSPDHGRAYRQVMRAQTANPEPKSASEKKALAGLDPDEARIIFENYSRSLSPKDDQKKKPSSVIVVEDDDEPKKKTRD